MYILEPNEVQCDVFKDHTCINIEHTIELSKVANTLFTVTVFVSYVGEFC